MGANIVNAGFHVAADSVRLADHAVAKGWRVVTQTTTGTLTQTVRIRESVKFSASLMLCEMEIIGYDTDADDSEAVVFDVEFTEFSGLWIQPVAPLATGFSSPSVTGFTYEFNSNQSNLTVYWRATGALLVAI